MENEHRLLNRVLVKKRALPEDVLYNYAMILFTSYVAMVLLAAYIVWRVIINDLPTAAAGVLALAACVCTLLLLRKNKILAAALLLATGITLFTVICIALAGQQQYYFLNYLLVLLFQSVIRYNKRWVYPVSVLVLLALAMGGMLIFEKRLPLLREAGGQEPIAYKIISLLLVFCICVWLVYLRRAVQNYIHENRQENAEDSDLEDYIDRLTQLYNVEFAKKYFDELEQIGGAESCLAVADLDNFKKINDTYGFEMGDVVIKKVADILVTNTRKSDLIFRWKGEGFLLLVNARLSDTYRLLEKIRLLINEEVFHSSTKGNFHISVTIGVVKLDTDNIAKSLDLCDRKLYIGKKTGKNIVVM